MSREYEIKLREGVTPFNLTTPHRIPIPLLPKVQAELKRMEDMEVIEKVDQPTEWSSPVVVVPKKNGKVRIWGDFIQLNKAVLRENHQLPTTEQTLAKLAGAKIVSKFDANSGFWQRKISLNSKLLTTFKDNGVTLNIEKCKFAKEKIQFLGHLIGKDGIEADPSKVEAITQMEALTNISELRRFLGMVNQMGKYQPNLAQTSKPLRDLLSKDTAWMWDSAKKHAFETIKRQLVSTPVLAIYDPQLQTQVIADASSYGIGAVMVQKHLEGTWKPVAFISRALSSTEEKYAPIEKEALATTWASERLADYLIGKTFHIETDHKPLVPLLGKKTLDEMPQRIQRLRMRLLRFDFTISHVPGKELTTANALSRAPSKSTSGVKQKQEIELYVENILLQLPASDKRLEEIAAAQKEDPICRKLFEYCKEEWPDMIQKLPSSLSPYWSSRGEISQVQGLLLKGPRLIIPSSMRLEILDRIHDGHQGIVK